MASSPVDNTEKQPTEALLEQSAGDPAATEPLSSAVYAELRTMAGRFMARERRDHTLQPTAVVHEVYLKLIDQSRVDWKDRAHFLAIAARAMRHLLVDHARRHRAAKRGGAARRLTLSEVPESRPGDRYDVLDVNEALDELDRLNERHRQVVELRFFGGLTVDDAAHVLGVSPQTVRLDWYTARAWLREKLASRAGSARPDL